MWSGGAGERASGWKKVLQKPVPALPWPQHTSTCKAESRSSPPAALGPLPPSTHAGCCNAVHAILLSPDVSDFSAVMLARASGSLIGVRLPTPMQSGSVQSKGLQHGRVSKPRRAVPRAWLPSPACSNRAPNCHRGFEICPAWTTRAFAVGNKLLLKFRWEKEKSPVSGLMPMLHHERSGGSFHGGKGAGYRITAHSIAFSALPGSYAAENTLVKWQTPSTFARNSP